MRELNVKEVQFVVGGNHPISGYEGAVVAIGAGVSAVALAPAILVFAFAAAAALATAELMTS